LLGPFEEEEEGAGIASEVVKVKGEDPATPDLLPQGIDPGTVTIPHYRFNKTKQHTHGMYFFSFFSKPKTSKKRRNVTNFTNPQPLQSSFQTFHKYLCFEERFAVVWFGQIHNLETGHVYVLGLKSSSERLLQLSQQKVTSEVGQGFPRN